MSDRPIGNFATNVAAAEAFASRNHAIVPRSVALEAGVDDAAIHRCLRDRRWIRVHAKAYLVAGALLTWRSRLAAAAASLERDFVFSHRTVRRLMGLDGVPEGFIEAVTTRGAPLNGVRLHRVAQVPRSIRIDGFPVTTAHRTILDLFAVLPPSDAELALDDALRKRLTSIDRLWSEYAVTCAKGRNGCKGFRRALLRRDHRDGTLQSRMEARLRRALSSIQPSAVPQFEVATPQRRYFIDFAYPDIKLGIEAQSIKWHLGEAKFFYDLRRDRDLKRAGWTVIYYSWDDLLRPLNVQRDVAGFRALMQALLF